MTGDAVGGSTAKRKIAFAVFLAVCLAVALTVGLVLNFRKEDVKPDEICKRSDVIVDCHPESDATEEKCKTRGCVWAPVSDERAPKCKFPAGYGYRVVGDVKETPMGMRIELERTPHPQYLTGSASIDNIYLDVEFQTDARLRFRFYPKNGTRWEIPDSVLNITSPSTKASETSRLYNVTIVDDPMFGVLVTRTSDNQTVFNTTLPGFVYSDQYLQLTTRLASDNVYGFGEHNHRQLRHDLGWKTWSIFTRDVAPVVWPGTTGYPDFTNPNTEAWWEKWARYFYNNESIQFDSLWIDMNEPSSFIPGSVDGCEKNKWNNPPYTPNILGRGEDGRMYDKTLCMDSRHDLDSHYNVHSLYAHTQAIQTYNALASMFPGKRPWTMTRSSFAGTGKYATKWMGDNQARWEQMKWSIIGILEFGLFGFSLNGADICGFWYEAEYEMCVRWHQLGAFYPFARNHNALGDAPHFFKPQDPAAWDARFIRLAKEALVTRYRLLPYFYTLMHNAHARGDTVMRPLLFEFPDDPVCLSVDEQFLLGSALLVSPVLYEGKTSVKAYFPEATWYDYFQGEKVAVKKKHLDLYTPLEKFNLHVRGGHVIPWQVPANTTHASRQNKMGAIVALDEEGRAHGELFWDDGENIDTYENKQYSLIEFGMTKAGELHVGPTVSGSGSALPPLDMLDIYGLQTIPLTVTLDGEQVPVTNIRQSFAIIQLLNLNMTLAANHTITWS